jgi:hypothetical protein
MAEAIPTQLEGGSERAEGQFIYVASLLGSWQDRVIWSNMVAKEVSGSVSSYPSLAH